MSNQVRRIGTDPRWSDIVVHQNTAYWVEVAEDPAQDPRSQIEQVFMQTDQTLATLGTDRKALIQVLIYLADLAYMPTLNELWDAWVPAGHAPVRACVQVALGKNLHIELVIQAAVTG